MDGHRFTGGSRAERLLLPSLCLLCGRPDREAQLVRDLCKACLNELPWQQHACQRCAMPLQVADALCGRCVRQPPPQDYTLAALRYEHPVIQLIHAFKFHGHQVAGRVLGELFARGIRWPEPAPHALLPVPLHATRLAERGFNQSSILSMSLDARLTLQALVRTRATEAQAGMSAIVRRRNLRAAFQLNAANLPAHVVIVDDVMTTGSTVSEIAALLRRSGVQHIGVMVLARTP